MASYMEELLGVKFGREDIPGTITKNDEGVVYIEDSKIKDFDSQLDTIFGVLDKISSAGDGAIRDDACRIYLPDDHHTLFHAIAYRGDLEGWKHDIEAAAKVLGLLTATIKKDKIVLSDGRSYKLSNCKIEDDLARKDDSSIQEEKQPFIYQEDIAISKYRAENMLENIDALKQTAEYFLKDFELELALKVIEKYKKAIKKDPKLWREFEEMLCDELQKNKLAISSDVESYLSCAGEIAQSAK